MRLAIIFTVLLISCNSNPAEKRDQNADSSHRKEAEKIIVEPATELSYSCYWKTAGRDTLVAWLVQKDNKVTGKLSFDNFQKDGSSGPVEGTIESNVLKLWYAFESEGIKSVMEVWFRKEGSMLVRAVGPSEVKQDTSYFPDQSSIHFDERQALALVDCSVVPAKYK